MTEEEYENLKDRIDEVVQRKWVIRDGKRLVKLVTNKDGFKISGGKETRMSEEEVKRRQEAAKKAAIKRNMSLASSTRKRRLSQKHRRLTMSSR